MEPIELSRNNWIFIILAVMLFSLVSCTKDELPAEENFSPDPLQIENQDELIEPTDFHR